MLNTEDVIKSRIVTYGHGYKIIDCVLDTTISNLSTESEKEIFTISFLERNIIWTNPVQDDEGNHYAQRITIDWLDEDEFLDYGIIKSF